MLSYSDHRSRGALGDSSNIVHVLYRNKKQSVLAFKGRLDEFEVAWGWDGLIAFMDASCRLQPMCPFGGHVMNS